MNELEYGVSVLLLEGTNTSIFNMYCLGLQELSFESVMWYLGRLDRAGDLLPLCAL